MSQLFFFQEHYKKPVISTVCWHVHCEECWLHTLVRLVPSESDNSKRFSRLGKQESVPAVQHDHFTGGSASHLYVM